MSKTFNHSLKQICQEDPTYELFVFYDSDMTRQSLQAEELFTLASKFAHILHKAGIKRGDTVGVSLPLSMELVIANVGTYLAGGAAVNLDGTAADPKIFYHCLNKSECKLLVHRTTADDLTWGLIKNKLEKTQDGDLIAKIEDNEAPRLKQVLTVQRQENQYKGQTFLDMIKNYPDSYADLEVTEDDPHALYMSSGTTGMPKVVVRTHRTIVEDGKLGIEAGLTWSRPNVIFMSVPWSWAVATLMDTLSKKTRVQPDLWTKPKDSYKLYAAILKEIPGCMAFLTPPEMEGIQKIWDLPDRKIAHVLIVGGFSFNKKVVSWLLTIGDALIIRYGSSEAIPVATQMVTKIEDYQDFDCGQVCEGTIVKSVDENLQVLPKGMPGRLLIYTKAMFKCYLGEPAKTKETMTDDGGFLGGDAGYVNEKGRVIVLGRYDYIINHNNQIYYPTTIEKIIRDHPAVSEVIVVPLPNDGNHHNVCACVVLKPGSDVTEADLIQSVADQVAQGTKGVLAPHHVVFFDSFKVSERGKVNMVNLIANAKKAIKMES